MKTDIVNDFLVYVIEEYKFLEEKTAKDTMELFTKYNVFDYITKNYSALHTMGGRAIADDINLLMGKQ
jgi:dihydroorotate dehydrogenase